MLKHAGMLEPQPAMIPVPDVNTSRDLQWRAWLHRESQNRYVFFPRHFGRFLTDTRPSLVYNWVMNDGELSLFSDTTPMLAVTDLACPLPGPEALWLSRNTDEFFDNVQRVYGGAGPHAASSLLDLFQEFVGDNIANGQASMTPQHLRLLLHPLQSMLAHQRQMLSCFGEAAGSPRRGNSRSASPSGAMSRVGELQGLLQRWYELATAMRKENPACEATQTNLVLYHLISLNAVTDFPEIERLARREAFDGSAWQLAARHARCVSDSEEAVFHCGQVMRLVRAMPADRRPCWWTAALYRATLILWVEGVARASGGVQQQQQRTTPSAPGTPRGRRPHQRSSSSDSMASATSSLAAGMRHATLEGGVFAVDGVTPEDPVLIRYLWKETAAAAAATPVLTRADGGAVALERPGEVLAYGVAAIEEGTTCRVGDGIKRKLTTLGQRWAEAGVV